MSTAGELDQGDIGRIVRFTTEDGATIEDTLTNIVHFEDITYIRVRTVIPDGAIRQQMVQFSSAFRLKPTDHVGVVIQKEDKTV